MDRSSFASSAHLSFLECFNYQCKNFHSLNTSVFFCVSAEWYFGRDPRFWFQMKMCSHQNCTLHKWTAFLYFIYKLVFRWPRLCSRVNWYLLIHFIPEEKILVLRIIRFIMKTQWPLKVYLVKSCWINNFPSKFFLQNTRDILWNMPLTVTSFD